MAKHKLLILGSSGFLGWHLARQASAKWEVYGTYWNHHESEYHHSTYQVDLTVSKHSYQLLDLVKPDWVVFLAAISNTQTCNNQPQFTLPLNVIAPVEWAKECAARGIPFHFASSDMVFSGEHPLYTETDFPHPVLQYGWQKREAEEKILEVNPRAGIFRFPLMIGLSGKYGVSSLSQLLRPNKQCSLFLDEYRTPLVGEVAAKYVCELGPSFSGILHLGSEQSISRYELGTMIARNAHLPIHIIAKKQADFPQLGKRPRNLSFNITKLKSTGIQIISLQEQLNKLCIELVRNRIK